MEHDAAGLTGATNATDPTEEGFDRLLAGVGPRLRALRRGQDATLAQIAASTGISVSTLSRLESGERRPTLELLLPLASAYQVALDELVDARPVADPRVRGHPFVRGGMTFVPLTRRTGGLQAYKIVIPERVLTEDPEQQVHDGHDWFYVLSGRLRLRLGDRDLMLSAGEVAEFDTRVPHWLGNPGPGPTEILALFGPQGERMHVRVRPGGAPEG